MVLAQVFSDWQILAMLLGAIAVFTPALYYLDEWNRGAYRKKKKEEEEAEKMWPNPVPQWGKSVELEMVQTLTEEDLLRLVRRIAQEKGPFFPEREMV